MLRHVCYPVVALVTFSINHVEAQQHKPLTETEPNDLGNVIRGPLSVRQIGTRHKAGEGYIQAELGIEQWESGQRQTHQYQTWRIHCAERNPLSPKAPWCSVERVVIDNRGAPHVLRGFRHDSADQSLRLKRFDWVDGILDFVLVSGAGISTDVVIRFSEYLENYYKLDSFRAISVYRSDITNNLETIEYRIPQYTYLLNVPVVMTGMNDAGLKEWDELYREMSSADKDAWNSLRAGWSLGKAGEKAWKDLQMRFPALSGRS